MKKTKKFKLTGCLIPLDAEGAAVMLQVPGIATPCLVVFSTYDKFLQGFYPRRTCSQNVKGGTILDVSVDPAPLAPYDKVVKIPNHEAFLEDVPAGTRILLDAASTTVDGESHTTWVEILRPDSEEQESDE